MDEREFKIEKNGEVIIGVKSNLTMAPQWECTGELAAFKKPEGYSVLRQKWVDRTTGKIEWRPIPEIFNS